MAEPLQVQPHHRQPAGWPPPARSAWKAWGRNALLFMLTAVSIFLAGGLHEIEGGLALDVSQGLLLSASLLAILLAHEMGHYLACRYYRVDATLPFFIPFPLGLVGTLGAFIRIRAPIPDRRALFDIGIAGPLAGFFACLPVLWLGVLEGRLVPLVNGGEGPGYLGEPLLFRWMQALLIGPAPEGMTLAIGPLGTAAWFGLFVTALNMMPVGQLDGGHVSYALWPRHALRISRVGLAVCVLLLYLRPTWLLWTLLLLLLGRRRHPPTISDWLDVGRGRVLVGLFGFAVFAVCFTPSPIMLSWRDVLPLFGF